jgi:hypothetical protein
MDEGLKWSVAFRVVLCGVALILCAFCFGKLLGWFFCAVAFCSSGSLHPVLSFAGKFFPFYIASPLRLLFRFQF